MFAYYYIDDKRVGFYSKLVRLKVISLLIVKVLVVFLFQIGAIKSAHVASEVEHHFEFLFQIGAIKSADLSQIDSFRWCVFLFQIGAIKRCGQRFLIPFG